MKAVWLSSTYYLDPRIIDLSEGAECLFNRSIAYSGAAETGGFVPKNALKTLGIGAVNRKKSELVSSGLWIETERGYRLSGWDNWQGSGDDLLKRRKSDRERKAKQRERSRDGHVMSRGENRIEENKEKELTSAKPPREDVELLCKRLHDRIVSNGSKSIVTEGWRTAARLMLDRDDRDLDKALRLIDWCQDDDFWRPVILSMTKFRAKYDQMRLRANSEATTRSTVKLDVQPGSLPIER